MPARAITHTTTGRHGFFVFATLSIPVVFFALLETGLRLFGYGPNLALFVTEEVAGKVYHVMNPDVKHRYFSRVEFSPNTSPDYFVVPKPAGTFRIFCLGGSTTVGFPYGYVGSFSTFLRDRLRATFPEKNIEVINLGLTATNSYTVADIAAELVDCDPDLLIVYDGHNEFYGALGIASFESAGDSRWSAKLHLRLIHIRTFLLVREVLDRMGSLFRKGEVQGPQGTLMERLARGKHVPFGSGTYGHCLENFRSNLQEFREIAEECGIPAIVTSQVSNLRHQVPFVSAGDTFRAGEHYRRAQQLDGQGDTRAARREYEKARDFDQLRFRASTDFNKAIREVSGSRAVFVDMEQFFSAHSPDSIVGKELVLEHLHPNAYGYFLMARAYARAMRNAGFLAEAEEWRRRDTVSDTRLWDQRVMTELDGLCAQKRIEILTSGWPFREQSLPVVFDESDSLLRVVARMVKGEVTWEQGHVEAAGYYEARGDLDKAAKEYLALVNQVPLNVSPYLRLAQVRIRQGKHGEAAGVLRSSLAVEKTSFADRILGTMALNAKDNNEAVRYLEDAYALAVSREERTESGYLLALAYTRSGREDRAVLVLQEVLATDSAHRPSRELLRFLQR